MLTIQDSIINIIGKIYVITQRKIKLYKKSFTSILTLPTYESEAINLRRWKKHANPTMKSDSLKKKSSDAQQFSSNTLSIVQDA